MLPDSWVRSGGENAKPQGIVAYHEHLFMIGIDQEKHMQLMQFT